MGVSLKNSEGYADPTAYEAIRNIDRETKKNQRKGNNPLVYICSPFAGDIEGNTRQAKKYGRFAVSEGVVPVIPHLMYPQFLMEADPEERKLGIEMGLILLTRCREIWVFGKQISKGMSIEINKAKNRNMPIHHFTRECKKMETFEEKECFASRKGRCKVLNVRKCEGLSCCFFKTDEQLEKDRQKVLRRILSLGDDVKSYIIDTYYGGEMSTLNDKE